MSNSFIASNKPLFASCMDAYTKQGEWLKDGNKPLDFLVYAH